ncbi:hypothetical protein MASRES_GEN12929_17025 [Acinetobacter baumannii]
MKELGFILLVSLIIGFVAFCFDYRLTYPYFIWIVFLVCAIIIGYINKDLVKPKNEEKNLIIYLGEHQNVPDTLPGLNEDGVSYIPFYCRSGYYLNSPKTKNQRMQVVKEINAFMKKFPDYKILNIEHVCNDTGWLEEIGVWLIKKDNAPKDKPE